MDGVRDGDYSRSVPQPAKCSRLRRFGAAYWRFSLGFLRYSAYATLFLAIAGGMLALSMKHPSVKKRVVAVGEKIRTKYIAPLLNSTQNYENRILIKERLSEFERELQAGLADLKTTINQQASKSGVVVAQNAASSTPLVGAPAKVRALPYPFFTYLSVVSDPDSMKFADFEKIHALIHDKYQLNLSDQTFVSNGVGGKGESGLDVQHDKTPAEPIDITRFYKLLQAHRHGIVEGIHGWHSLAFASNETSFKLETKGSPVSQSIPFANRGVYDPQDHNYVVFEYRMPIAGSYCTLKANEQNLQLQSFVDQAPGMDCAIAWTVAQAQLPKGIADPQVEFTLQGFPGSYLEVRNLMLTNFSQARIAAERKFMQEYNLRFLVYSEHSRVRNELTLGARYDSANDTRPHVLADNPQQAPNFYLMPDLEELGVTFINASHHTAQADVVPISAIVHPHRFNDGSVRYNFKRFMSYPMRSDGTIQNPEMNLSWEPWLGYHVDRLLRKSTLIGDGGIVYTHWGVFNPTDSTLSEASLLKLEELQERHYNLSGKTQSHKRVWVAPAAEMLLYARAMDRITEHATYDEVANVVQVQSWYDSISRQTIPLPKTRAFGLANLTFYVRDSATARLLIDGREYTCLKRNPADHTGKQSVTIVDDYVPTVVFDEVDPLHKFGDVVSDNADSYFRHTQGFQGAKCLEIELQDTAGSSTWTLPAITSDHTSFVRFAYRKSNPKSRMNLRLTFEDGGELTATEGELEKLLGWQITPRDDDQWHDVVLDLADVQGPKPLKRVPRGKLKSITLAAADAKAGDHVWFDAIEFLRNPIHPPHPQQQMLIAGRVEPAKDGVKVILDDGQNKRETVTKQGYFFFPNGPVKGSTVRVFAQLDDKMPRFPTSGRYVEVQANEVDLVVPLEDRRDERLSKKFDKTYKALSELNTDVGRIYKPHSDYVHSGIGTPQEYENKLQTCNTGFLDRDRREANPDDARRILFLGNCNLFGHSTPRSYHAGIILEDSLTRATGYPTEVITLADSAMSFGKHWSYYAGLGRKLKPDVVCIFVHTSGVEHLEADPDLFARFFEYAPDHFPGTLFRSQADGSLKLIEPDPEYFQHIGKNEALHKERVEEQKKGGYYTDGVEWQTIYYREDWNSLPPPAKRAWDHFARVLKFYHDEMAKDGAKLMLVLTPEAQRMFGGTYKDFKDGDGYACHTRLFGERMEKVCRDAGVGCLNLTPHIERSYPDPALYTWRYDNHPSPYGFEMMAEGVQEFLLHTNFCENLPSPDPAEAKELAERMRSTRK